MNATTASQEQKGSPLIHTWGDFFLLLDICIFEWISLCSVEHALFLIFGRSLYIDFDAMTLRGHCAGLAIRRLSSESHNQREDMGWYYRDNSYWCEYGVQVRDISSLIREKTFLENLLIIVHFYHPTQGSSDSMSSISSQDLERQYNSNPTGSFQFKAGKYSYLVDFSSNHFF